MLPLDLRHALRGLVRRPAFTIAAVMTLALGIGANTAMFSAVWHLMLAPLPYPGGERIGWVWSSTASGFSVVPSRQEAEAFAASARSLEWIEPYSSSTLSWRGDGAAEVVDAGLITHTLPGRLAVSPVIGRSFAESETETVGGGVVLLSEWFWQTRMGGTTDALGSTLRLDGRPYEVIGVMPDRLAMFRERGPSPAVWLPLDASAQDRSNLVVLLREGSGTETVNAELTSISANVPEARLAVEQPETVIRQVGDNLGERTRTALFVLLAAVSVVLLIACANVAGLLLVRGGDRRRELAICAALGADRLAILRYLFIETALIALAGGATGLLLGAWGMELVRSIRPSYLVELETVALDPVVLAFAGAITLLTIAVFGVLPSVHAARLNLRDEFSATSGGSTGSQGAGRTGAALVVAEVALAVVLLVGASLLVRTMVELRDDPLGFEPAGALSFTLELPTGRYADRAAWSTFGDRLKESIEALPGVEIASLSTGTPPDIGVLFGEVMVEGSAEPLDENLVYSAAVDEDYFRALGVGMQEGRPFDGSAADETSVIVNRSTAERFWPGGNALGSRIRIGDDEAPWRTVVGIVPDIAIHGPGTDPTERPLLFTPFGFSYPFVSVAVRSRSGDPLAMVSALRNAVAAIDPDLPVRDAATIGHRLAESIGRERFNMTLFAGFAILALVLATVGLYGIVAYNVSRRTRELGIRCALGATPHGVRALVLRQGTMLAVTGAIIGAVTARALSRLMEDLLHGVTPGDPVSFAAAIVVVVAISLLASWIPARRASRVEPVVALRQM
jgi:predicted permease